MASGALTIADIKSGVAATRTLVQHQEALGPLARSGSVFLRLKVLPNVVVDLRRLGWMANNARRLDDAVSDAVVELVERAVALGLRPS